MKYVLVVFLATVAASSISAAQAKQKGISVNLPSTRNAVLVPAADKEDALVVAIAQDGSVYFGVEKIPSARLTERAKEVTAKRSDKTVYVKADVRAPSSELVAVLDAFAGAGASRIALLAEQQGVREVGDVVPPAGLELRFVRP